MHTQFLTEGLADELHLVVAPFFVGDSRARRFVGDGRFPWNADRRAPLAEARALATPEELSLNVKRLQQKLDRLPDWFRAREYQIDDATRIAYQLQIAQLHENEIQDDEAAIEAKVDAS